MYEKHFGLLTRPFSLTPDPRFLYRSRQHERALTMLQYGLTAQAPVLLLSGEVGAGKTLLVNHLLEVVAHQVEVGLLNQTHPRQETVLDRVVAAFGLDPRSTSDLGYQREIADACRRAVGQGRRLLLVVDEAQNLQEPVLEELRLLSNLNDAGPMTLQIMLVGQPEVREMLSRPGLGQLAQRVSADYHLRALDVAEVAAYVAHRLAVAGAAPELFDAEALALIHEVSGGIPRLVNQLCDYALVYAFSEGLLAVDAAVVHQVLADRSEFGALPLFNRRV
jgi:type II secretory pathway predicted ATPase ExeA